MTKITRIEGSIGHYGDRTGAHGLVDEVQQSRRIAQRVHSILTANGVPNSLYEDKISKNQRDNINHLVKHHNSKGANTLVVSYHLNSSGGTTNSAIGAEVLYKTQGTLSKNLVDAICKSGGFKNRGAKYRSDLGLLNGTTSPSVLLETFFVNSRTDVDLYEKNFEQICFAIAEVLAEFIGYKIKSNITIEKVPHRIKSGTYSTRQKAEDAKKQVAKYGIASEKFITIGQNVNGGYFFQTGSYQSKEDAEKALAEMKKLSILTNGHILKA